MAVRRGVWLALDYRAELEAEVAEALIGELVGSYVDREEVEISPQEADRFARIALDALMGRAN